MHLISSFLIKLKLTIKIWIRTLFWTVYIHVSESERHEIKACRRLSSNLVWWKKRTIAAKISKKKYDKENYQITTKLIRQMKRSETN